MTPLIDATEMYLRTVWELEEEGITPIRARLVERLGLSAPAVSETVARLEHEGLVQVAGDRTLALTEKGREIAISVMRKHRLAERLLTDVIGLEWEQVHNEACRWEHVISDAVEQRLVELLHAPTTCPHGNPIPGLAGAAPPAARVVSLAEAAKRGGCATVARISEKLQVDVAAMRFLREHGVRPGVETEFAVDGGAVVVRSDGEWVALPEDTAEHVYVAAV
jgi:DtxR family Mn-dependent transcriptional regulator